MSDASSFQRFAWGLSVGIRILAMAGWIWFGWAASAAPSLAPAAIVFWAATIGAAGLIWAGLRVRRLAASFRYRDLRHGSAEQRQTKRRIYHVFTRAIAAEWILVGLSAFLTYHFGRGDLFPAAISLAVSLHFIPLAVVLGLRIYFATAAAGCFIGLAGLLAPISSITPETRLILVCSGFGGVLWGTAVYMILNARRLSEAAAV